MMYLSKLLHFISDQFRLLLLSDHHFKSVKIVKVGSSLLGSELLGPGSGSPLAGDISALQF